MEHSDLPNTNYTDEFSTWLCSQALYFQCGQDQEIATHSAKACSSNSDRAGVPISRQQCHSESLLPTKRCYITGKIWEPEDCLHKKEIIIMLRHNRWWVITQSNYFPLINTMVQTSYIYISWKQRVNMCRTCCCDVIPDFPSATFHSVGLTT